MPSFCLRYRFASNPFLGLGGKWDLHRTCNGLTWEVLGKYKTIHVLLKNDREKQVILQIINFFFTFSLFFRLKFIILPKNKLLTVITMENFNDIIKSGQLTLVDFYATWCGPCKMMHPILEQLKEALGDSIRIIKIDVDKNEAVSMQYRIQSVPTFMLFKNGEAVWRQSGTISLNDLKNLISQHL